MVYTLKQAAEAAGKGKPAILKAIKVGRVSANKNEKGEWEIDPSELHRVYPAVSETTNQANKSVREETPSELIELRVKVKILEEQLTREKEQCDKWEQQAERMSLILTDQRSPKEKPTTETPVNQNSGAVGRFKGWLLGNTAKK